MDPKYQNELNTIEADARNDAATSCRKMFSKWLNTDQLASWDKLIKALRIVQLNNVASDIERLLLQGELIYLDIIVVGGADDHVILYNDQLQLAPSMHYIVFSVCACSFLMEASHHPVTFPGRFKLVIVCLMYMHCPVAVI